MAELTEDERRFLSELVERVREDLEASDDLREEHDADAFTRSMLLEGFPMQEGGLEAVARSAGLEEEELERVLGGLVGSEVLEVERKGESVFLRLDEGAVGSVMRLDD